MGVSSAARRLLEVFLLCPKIWFWQQPSAKQLDTSASVHLPLQGFEAVDLSLDRLIAPRFCNRPFHRVKVLFQSANKAIHRMNSCLLGSPHAAMQGCQLAHAQNRAEDHPGGMRCARYSRRS